jgi:hypothetical protein
MCSSEVWKNKTAFLYLLPNQNIGDDVRNSRRVPVPRNHLTESRETKREVARSQLTPSPSARAEFAPAHEDIA